MITGSVHFGIESFVFSPNHSPTRMIGPTIEALGGVSQSVVPLSSDGSPPDDRTLTFTVKLGSWAYPTAWAGIYLLHVACLAYCIAAAKVFNMVVNTMINTAWQLDFAKATLPTQYFPTFALVHYLFAAVHGAILTVSLGQFLYKTLQSIRQRFKKRDAAVHPERRTNSAFADRVASIPLALQRRVPAKLQKPIAFVYKKIFSLSGLLGVEYRYHDAFFLLREVVETALQTQQAYQMSRLLARPRLNRFFVATLVVNCWATPVLHHLVANKPLQRLWVRLCDIALDFVASVGVPTILTLGYLPDYDPAFEDFPFDLWVNDKWFINIMNESPLIFFGTWFDVVGRLVFSVGLLSSLNDVKLLIKRGPGISFAAASAALRRKSTKQSEPKSLRALPATTTPTKQQPSRRTPPAWFRTQRSRVTTLAHRLMFAFGFVVLGIHLYAELRSTPSNACLLKLRPWLVAKPACALVEINCWRDRQITGKGDDFAHHVGDLDPYSLNELTFRHCPAVEIQHSIQGFPNLLGLKFFNTTLVSWDEHAALQESCHAKMRLVYMVRTTFPNGTFPAGLITPNFPLLLRDLQFSATNLDYIPDDLDSRWPPGIAIYLEDSQLTAFPLVFARMQFDALVLSLNPIANVPAEAFEAPGLLALYLTGTAITELPADADASVVNLNNLDIYGTNVSAVPSWVSEWLLLSPDYRIISAGLTPWCEEVQLLKANETAVENDPWLAQVRCRDRGPAAALHDSTSDERSEEVW